MCIFCKIANKEIPSSIVYEDDKVIAIDDINPQAPVHVLVIPKTHSDNIVEFSESEPSDVKAVMKAIAEVSRIKGLNAGFRVINNCGKAAGQTVEHVHFHVLGGVDMSETLIK